MEQLIKLWAKIIILVCYLPSINNLGLMRLVPARYSVMPIPKTYREAYELERQLYRRYRDYTRHYGSTSRRTYYLHKAVAEKYGWPYIKEVYDRDA